MAANKYFRLGPIALSATLTTNIFNPGTTTGGTNCTASPYGNLMVIFRLLRVINKTNSATATVTLYIGATGTNAAGTEIALASIVPANSFLDLYWPGMRMDTADFLVGGASAGTTLVLVGVGEIGIA